MRSDCVFSYRRNFRYISPLRWLITLSLVALAGCVSVPTLPKTLAEQHASYTYIPLDPLPVSTRPGRSCEAEPQTGPSAQKTPAIRYKDLLKSLPDQAVRIAVATYDGSGTLVFGPFKSGAEGHSYEVILDYISVDTANVPVYVERLAERPNLPPKEISVYDQSYVGTTTYRVQRDPKSDLFLFSKGNTTAPPGDRVNIPVYIGVGLRLTALITVTKGNANLSSLGAIAAGAEAGNLTGSLVVQTLGVTGKSVATTLPLPSELNQTTVQNAILALGSIKAILYSEGDTEITPRVVGIYNPIGGGQQVVNGIISVLASDPIVWYRPCVGGQQL
jgi:hypothetical protein